MDYHILIDGKPKCESYDHIELLGLRVCCGHKNIRDAEAAATEIRAALPKCRVIIQEGECPESLEYHRSNV